MNKKAVTMDVTDDNGNPATADEIVEEFFDDSEADEPDTRRTTIGDRQKILSISTDDKKIKIVFSSDLAGSGYMPDRHTYETHNQKADLFNECFSNLVLIGMDSLGQDFSQIIHNAAFVKPQLMLVAESLKMGYTRRGELDEIQLSGYFGLPKPYSGSAKIVFPPIAMKLLNERHMSDYVWDLIAETKKLLARNRRQQQLTFDSLLQIDGVSRCTAISNVKAE